MALAADEVLRDAGAGPFEPALAGRVVWREPPGEGLSALAMTAPGSGPAAFGQFRPPWRPPLNGWVGWKTDWRLSSI